MPDGKVIDIVSAIHKRVREQAASSATPGALEDWSNDLAKLSSAYNTAYGARNLVGSVPQLPNTFAGFAARWIIRIAQRMLFWYTPQIRYFNEAVTSVLNRLSQLEERKYHVFLAMADRLETLERESRLFRIAQSADHPAAPPANTGALHDPAVPYTRSPIDARNFYFALQGRFQSSVQLDTTRLELYRSAISNLKPCLPVGTWLDIGCGRGKWLRLARDIGHECIGVDSSPDAIRRCRDEGFEVLERDALEFLQSADDQSFAVVSAFHVLEHCPFEYYLNLVYQITRTLKPGGVLLIETPHPGNLLMAAEQFWMDPTHNRPIPLPLMEFLFEYCGLRVVHRFEVNPRPESEHLPLRELELSSRLDLMLFGPQDYAVIGRRDV
jgi:SAM-dependent methyltransferase